MDALLLATLLLVVITLLLVAPWLAEVLIGVCARRLPHELAFRMHEEWVAEIGAVSTRPGKLAFALALAMTRRRAFAASEDFTAEIPDRSGGFFAVFGGWKATLALPTMLFAAAAYGASFLVTPMYESQMTIVTVPQQVPQEYVRSTVTTRLEDRLQAIQAQIMSRTQLERVILDFNLYPEERKNGVIMEELVERVRPAIAAPPIGGDAFVVSFRSEQPLTALRVTERLASMFIDQSLRDREVLAVGTTQFLESQLEDARRALIDKEKEVESYRRQHNGQMPDQLASNQSTISSIQGQLQNLHISLNQDKERQITLEQQIANAETLDLTTVPAGQMDYTTFLENKIRNMNGGTAPASAAEQLKVAQDKLQAARMKYKPEHPEVQKLERDAAKAQEAADMEAANTAVSSAGLSPAEQLKRNAIKAATEQLATLEKQITENIELEKKLRGALADYQARVEGTPTREVEMTDMTRNYGILQQQYNSLLSKTQEAKISANLEQRQIGESFKIQENARLPLRPFSPNRPVYATIGALVGAALGGMALAGFFGRRRPALAS